MVHRSIHRPTRRVRSVFGWLLASLVLALSIGSFASVAAADEQTDPPSASSDVVAAAAVDPPETANNPAPDQCGLNMVIVLDRSGSTAGSDAAYKGAADAFVNSFVGTPSHIGLVTFASTASVTSGYVDVSSSGATLTGIIDGLGTPTGNTNWQDAFLKAQDAAFTGTKPDLVVFITDGNPTTQNGGFNTNLGAGMSQGNALKANGLTHITGVAVGVGIDINNIKKITGTGGVIDPSSAVDPNYDVYQPATPADLQATLAHLTTQICGATVHIHKQLRTGPGNLFANGAGWAFNSPNADVADQVTDASGNTDFGFAFSQTGKSQTITETLQAGYTLEGFSCDGGSPQAAPNGFALTVKSEDDINCTVTNTPALGSITLNKITTHGVGGPFNFAVTGGAVGVNLHRSATTTQQNTSTATTGDSLAGLYPGAYTIVESSPAGWNPTGIACNDGNEPVDPPDGNGNITLGVGENLTCTYTNDLVATDLEIVKTASGPSSVNGGNDQQIDYTLTVDNNGPGDVHNAATVTDVLPASASLVSIDPPAGVTCGIVDQTITCNIPADQLEVSDPAVVIGITITVPTNGQTVTNKTIVDSPDDPAPCTVTSDDITCTEETNNYSQVSTDIPNVEPPDVPDTPADPSAVQVSPATATVSPVQVEAAQVAAAEALAFTGSNSSVPFAAIGASLVAVGAFVLVLSRRRRKGTVTE